MNFYWKSWILYLKSWTLYYKRALRIWGENNDEFCIKNDEFCIKNDEFCIKNDEFCSKLTPNGSAKKARVGKPRLITMRFSIQKSSLEWCKIHDVSIQNSWFFESTISQTGMTRPIQIMTRQASQGGRSVISEHEERQSVMNVLTLWAIAESRFFRHACVIFWLVSELSDMTVAAPPLLALSSLLLAHSSSSDICPVAVSRCRFPLLFPVAVSAAVSRYRHTKPLDLSGSI